MSKKQSITEKSNVTGSWTLWVEPSGTRLSDGYETTAKLYDQLCESGDDFYRPREVELQASEYEVDELISDVLQRRPDWVDRWRRSIDEMDRIQSEQLDDLVGPRSEYLHVHEVDLTSAVVFVETGNGCVPVDRSSSMYVHEDESSSNGISPYHDLLESKIRWHNSGTPEQALIVSTHSDLWFEESARGEENRAKLSGFLNTLCESLPVSAVDFESYYYDDVL